MPGPATGGSPPAGTPVHTLGRRRIRPPPTGDTARPEWALYHALRDRRALAARTPGLRGDPTAIAPLRDPADNAGREIPSCPRGRDLLLEPVRRGPLIRP
jgi:hypothetical protein